jgi:hypothetical protein
LESFGVMDSILVENNKKRILLPMRIELILTNLWAYN